MIMNLSDIKNHNFSFSGINVILQYPAYRQLSLLNVGRSRNGFIYIKDGRCKFSFKEGSFTATKGNIVYLPLNSKHIFSSKSESLAFYRIDFNLKIGDEFVFFSNYPIMIADSVTQECHNAIISLCNEINFNQDNIFKTEKLCTIFKSLQDLNLNENYKRLVPAICYINEHYAETLDCHLLAKLCNISLSRFYELFKDEFKITPLKYRNRIILQKAKVMLEGCDMSIKEISLVLGFNNTAYFSRFFKKHIKKSPSDYIKSRKQKRTGKNHHM